MKWSWRKALGMPLPVVAPAEITPAPREPLRLTMADVMAASAPKAGAVPLEDVFRPYKPMDGVVPKGGAGMAMDALPAVIQNPISAFGGVLQSALHEGLYFMGYPYLAQLAQRAEYRHACEIWAEHTTRKWIKLRGPDDKVKAINDELTRLNARAVFQHAAQIDNLFGRSQVFLDFGDFDNEAELGADLVIDPGKISKARPLARLRVIEPMWTSPAPYNTSNPLAPDFYVPSAWYIYGKKVSATRLMTIVGRPVPDMLKPAYGFGGQALTALMKPYVDNWLRTRQSASDLLHSFSVMVLGTNMEDMLAPGALTSLASRIQFFNNYRDNNGLMVVNKADEELKNVSAPIAGVEGLVGQAQEQMAAAARIPLSIYLQITPNGLNASSENEIRSFYADVHAYQEDNFRPALQRIIECIQLSLGDAIDPEIGFEFEPLWEMSDKDRADIIAKEAIADAAYINAGVVDPEETRDRLRNDESGLYFGTNLSAPAPEPEEKDDDNTDDGAGDDEEGGA
jgi:hypothetical protein